MSFEVPLEAVGGRRRRWSAPAVLLGGLAILGLAVAPDPARDRAGATSGVDASATSAVAHANAVAHARAASIARAQQARPRQDRSVPARLVCGDVDRTTCLRIATAAVRTLPDEAPPVNSAAIWSSLLCSDSLECPSEYLVDSRPLGSVVLTFADGGRRIAMNVVDWRNGIAIHLGPRAWIARWSPEPD